MALVHLMAMPPAQAEKVSAPAPDPKLARAAHEFEGQMMKQLLAPMTASDSLTGEEDSGDPDMDSGAGPGGALSQFASESLGQALSERGGFGIADRILQDLARAGNRHGTGGVTLGLHADTVMRKLQ